MRSTVALSSPGVRLFFVGLERVAGLRPAGQPGAAVPTRARPWRANLSCVRDPVDHARSIVAHIHRPVATEHNPHRTPHPAAFLRFARREPSGNEVFRTALGLAFIVEFHSYNLVSGRNA